ncbi:MAG: hypothetical protein MJ237_05980 [bacterium]|nr:hypothetical protein [bacterium]
MKKTTENIWKGIEPHNTGTKLMEHSYLTNSFVNRVMCALYRTPMQVVWAGDYADNEKNETKNLFGLVQEKYRFVINLFPFFGYRYIINHDKMVYIDTRKIKADKWGYRINPLPLLTAEGNDRGGGDYRGINKELCGTWARNVISTDNRKPDTMKYTEVEYEFMEE